MITIAKSISLVELIEEIRKDYPYKGGKTSKMYHILTQMRNEAMQNGNFVNSVEFAIHNAFGSYPSIEDVALWIKAMPQNLEDELNRWGVLDLATAFYKSDKAKSENKGAK